MYFLPIRDLKKILIYFGIAPLWMACSSGHQNAKTYQVENSSASETHIKKGTFYYLPQTRWVNRVNSEGTNIAGESCLMSEGERVEVLRVDPTHAQVFLRYHPRLDETFGTERPQKTKAFIPLDEVKNFLQLNRAKMARQRLVNQILTGRQNHQEFSGLNIGSTHSVPDLEWVKIMEAHSPYYRKPETCHINFGAAVTVLGFSTRSHEALVRYKETKRIGGGCSSEALFFLPIAKLQTYNDLFQKKVQYRTEWLKKMNQILKGNGVQSYSGIWAGERFRVSEKAWVEDAAVEKKPNLKSEPADCIAEEEAMITILGALVMPDKVEFVARYQDLTLPTRRTTHCPNDTNIVIPEDVIQSWERIE